MTVSATMAPERLEDIRKSMAIARPLSIGLSCSIADELIAALETERARFDWYFGKHLKNDFEVDCLRQVLQDGTPDQWRSAIDTARERKKGAGQ